MEAFRCIEYSGLISMNSITYLLLYLIRFFKLDIFNIFCFYAQQMVHVNNNYTKALFCAPVASPKTIEG
jgi:hypothetical protein